MKLAIMQPYLFPYIGYFQLINAVDKFIIYDDVNYISRGWINRNNMQLNDQKHLFTIPILKASQNKLINELEFNFDEKWKRKFMKTLESAYKKSIFYEEITNMVNNILDYPQKNISSFIHNSLVLITSYLCIETEILPSSRIFNNTDLNGQERILNICMIEKADTYINPIGGLEIYDPSLFRKNDISLYFISTDIYPPTFPSLSTFYPNISILDLLYKTTPDEINLLLNNYKLIV